MAAFRGGKNPFDEEDDKFEEISDFPEMASIKQQKELYEKRMIDSSFRSLRLINESQDIASETAAELESQRLQLERTQQNLIKMDADLNQTDRHINSMKSIWGSVENWFKKPVNPLKSSSVPVKSNPLGENNKNENAAIQNNLKSLDKKVDLSWGNDPSIRSQSSANQIVDKNLDHMLAGLQLLKSQGLALGAEIDHQNDLIEDIQAKSTKIDQRIDQQNLKVRSILK